MATYGTNAYSDETLREHDIRVEYDGSGNILYWAIHPTHKAATSDGGWKIKKYTHGANGITRIEGPLVGAWDDRATLSWA